MVKEESAEEHLELEAQDSKRGEASGAVTTTNSSPQGSSDAAAWHGNEEG